MRFYYGRYVLIKRLASIPARYGRDRWRKKMGGARYPRPPEIVDMSIEDVEQSYVARFRDCKPGAAFEDTNVGGCRRAEHRFIGGGDSGKHNHTNAVPPPGFTPRIMYLEHGRGNAAHNSRCRRSICRLQGNLDPVRRTYEPPASDNVPQGLGPYRISARYHSRPYQQQP